KDRIDIPETSVKHILLSGPLGAGKTSLAVGIGTEFAFSLGIGRYLTASKLVQSLADTATVPDEIKMVDGQMLWPLRWCELLIVDDLDAGLSTTQGAYEHLVDPDRFGVV